MAVKATDVLEASKIVATLPEALSGCQRAIATTGIDRTALNVKLEHPKVALPWLLEGHASTPITSAPITSALIFGREDRGLSKAELNYAQRFVQIPTHADYSSLNLAQAVAICCYELASCVQTTHSEDLATASANPLTHSLPPNSVLNLATLDQLEGYYQQLETLLLKIGYLHPHTAASRMEKIRQLYSRAQLSEAEVAMLRGMIRQTEWAFRVNLK
jgi:tRNA/rRNA methyltransferase